MGELNSSERNLRVHNSQASKDEEVGCQLLLISVPQRHHNCLIKGSGLAHMDSGGLAAQRGPGLQAGNSEYSSRDLTPILKKP